VFGRVDSASSTQISTTTTMSLFNRSNQARSPPSAFKLTGVASTDRAIRRVSRTHDEFEAALRNEDTMVLQEGRDMHTLGNPDNNTPHRNRSGSVNLTAPRTSVDVMGRRQTVSTPKHSVAKHTPAPATPVIVPPTPTSPEEDDSRRRSIYRAAGTASSPDLATLISKVRRSREEQPEERERTRSTTSSAFEIIEAHTPSKGRDRALTSPDSQGQRRTNRLAKAEKTLGISPGASSRIMADSDVGEGRSDREGKVSRYPHNVFQPAHRHATLQSVPPCAIKLRLLLERCLAMARAPLEAAT
jgi:hypothetical protein